ncbi:hypothetical protein [Croceitalea sp. P059]|uniref:hypothetical protein n=1 Tax=Croceitalea sp. P059 TaxID=3075601 RepID=UPI002884A120|nr:hypothetical protein [Croceitalea sp. P059]MDT0538812.1 hypothetical protein [Croceitalea sp. P059]
MKTLLVAIILILGMNNCQQNNVELNYLAQSRGLYLEIELHSNVLITTNQREGETKKRELSKIELEDLRRILEYTNFDNILSTPGIKSHYDAAAIASLNLTFKGNAHEFEFDHGNPPKNLEALVNKIITLSEIVE